MIWTRHNQITSVAIDDDTIVISKSDPLDWLYRTYVLARNEITWTLQHTLTLDADLSVGNGSYAAIDGDTIVVGQTDHLYVYVRNGVTWSRQADFPTDVPDLVYYRVFKPVAIDGDTIVAGELYVDPYGNHEIYTLGYIPEYHGLVRVFGRSGITWTQKGRLTCADEGALQCGIDVDIDGNTIVVGTQNALEDSGAFIFEGGYQSLHIRKEGTGSGEVASHDWSIDCGLTCTQQLHQYPMDTVITLTATPDFDNFFDGWSGACSGSAPTCTLILNTFKHVAATFHTNRNLALTMPGPGPGSVSSDPPGIDCPDGACTYNFLHGMVVTLTAATPITGSFEGWSGACNHANQQCILAMDAAQQLSATFKYSVALSLDTHVPASSVVGQGVSISYTVTAIDGGIPGGQSLVYLSGAICSGGVPAGGCVLSPTLAASTVVSVAYSGDSLYGRRVLQAPHAVNPAATSLTLDAPAVGVVGEPLVVAYTVTVDAPGNGLPLGTVTMTLGNEQCIGQAPSGNCLLLPVAAGSQPLMASYSGNNNFLGSQVNIPYTTHPASTTVVILATDPNPAVPFEPVIISYTVQVDDPGGGVPTGVVSVTSGAGAACSGQAPTGQCELTFDVIGAHALTVTYTGDANYGSSFANDTQAVVKAGSAITITAALPDPSERRQEVVVTYTVAGASTWPGAPTGAVTITIAGEFARCVGPLPTGTCILRPLMAGGKLIRATYGGDRYFASSFDLEAHIVELGTIDPTSVTLGAMAPISPVVGQPVVVSYTVATTATGTPSGKVIVLDDDNNFCEGTVAQGQCTLQPDNAGHKGITLLYLGDDDFNGSYYTSAYTLRPAATALKLSADLPDPSIMARPVTVYSQLTVKAPGAGTPSGKIQVTDGDGNSCSSSITRGRCTLLTTQSGLKTLTAAYHGDGDYLGSQDNADHEVYDIPIAGLVAQVGPPVDLGQPSAFNILLGRGSNVVYHWDFGDGSLPITSTALSISHTYAFPGDYNVTLLASNRGSAASTSVIARVRDVPISGLNAQSTPPIVLLGADAYFTATVTAGTNIQYQWNFGDGAPKARGAHEQHIYADLGDFQTSVIATNGRGSAATFAAPVTVRDEIIGLSAGSSSPTIWGQPTVFTSAVTSGVGVVYRWDFGNGDTLSTPDPYVVYTYPY
ncbi:MAG: PKD domain-containing protein, partial [Alphaproteobacteria bacterium]